MLTRIAGRIVVDPREGGSEGRGTMTTPRKHRAQHRHRGEGVHRRERRVRLSVRGHGDGLRARGNCGDEGGDGGTICYNGMVSKRTTRRIGRGGGGETH